ncbi:MAG: ATP-dependent helicase [Phycisphaerales bacterium]
MDDAYLESLFADLTEPQAQSVRHTEGPLLIVAAAGSGKTRVITRRIAYLISCGVPPWSILALTFTNKAAGEMRERVLHLLGGADSKHARGLTVTTFHALCSRLLRKYADQVGLKPDFTIYDTSDQTSLIKKVIEGLQLSTTNFQPRNVLSVISNSKNKLESPEAFAQTAHDFATKTIAKIYASYAKALRSANAVDFDDLLLLTAKGLNQSELFRRECQQRWRYLLIDEYQDTNRAQFEIASMIAGTGDQGSKGPNVCVVGDPDQSIYGWRGADISNILDFEAHYPGASVILLGENFRSTAPILNVADELIKNNKRRKDKPLFTKRSGGEPVEAVLCRDERHEAMVVSDWLRRRHDGDMKAEGQPWREMAVFYRTNALSRVMEEALRGAGIPYTIARGTAFYDREEIKNALAYLKAIANPADDVSLSRIANTPSRGIGDSSIVKLEEWAAVNEETLLEAMRQVGSVAGVTARSAAAIGRFVGLMDDWTGKGSFMGAEITGSLADLVNRVLKESGLEAMYRQQALTSKNEADEERLDNLAELVSSAREFELEYDPDSDPAAFPGVENAQSGMLGDTPPLLAMLRAYLESVTLMADADSVDPTQGSVTLMTLHAAKGLEFGSVAIIGLEEGMLPHMRARESEADLEEERRLFFVGITRAMRRLHLSAAKYRTLRGVSDRTIPSRFLAELPAANLSIRDLAGGFEAAESWDDHDEPVYVKERPRMHGAPATLTGMAAEFPPGTRVRHPQFGVGEVKSVTAGSQARVEVHFKDVGRKTLILEYARLTKIG